MFRFIKITALSSFLLFQQAFGVNDGDTWAGEVPSSDRVINLNNGDTINVNLQRDPSFISSRGDNFGYLGKNSSFTYSTNSGNSKLVLKSIAANMDFYIEDNAIITVNERSHLVIDLSGSTQGVKLTGRTHGGNIIVNGGILDIQNMKIFNNDGGSITVNSGGTINFNNISNFSHKALTSGASITNNGGTININSDVASHNPSSSAYISASNGGYFLHNSGTTNIGGSYYNAGFYNAASNQQRMESIVEVKSGSFNVNGNFENGKNNPSSSVDYYGIGKLMASSNAIITVGGNFISDAQGQGSLGNYRSTVDLNDASLIVRGNFNAYKSDISLTNLAKIYSTNFNLNSSATMNFIGGDLGFGYIKASNSASFDGTVGFKLAGGIFKNDNMSYLFLESPTVTGNVKEGAVTVYDSTGIPLSGYTSNIVKIGDKYFLVFGDANDVNNPNYPQADDTPAGGHTPGWDQGSGNGGNGGNGGSGGDSGNGGDGGNSGSNSGNTGSNTPTYSNPKDAISAALKDAMIISDADLQKASNDIENQFSLMQEERKTYQGSLMQHNMLGRIANTSRQRYAFNTEARFASLLADYAKIPYYVNLQEQESDNFYINALAGYSNYQNSNGSEYGVSFGYDKEVQDSFFGGFYASLSKSYIRTEGMQLDGFNYNVGLYSRVYMPLSIEVDLLGYYANSHNRYDRTFAGLINTHQGDYKRHNVGAQVRLGYRAEFANGHSLKPYVGAFGSFYYMPEYSENGTLPISRSLNSFTSVYGALGVEYRKLTDIGSFFISLEGVNGAPVFGHKNYEITMGNQRISYENEKELFANVFAGANFSLSKHLDLTASLMSQAYEGGFFNVNGSLGFRLSF